LAHRELRASRRYTYKADDNTSQHSKLSAPLWPQFDDRAYLNAIQAARFYRAAMGITGLIHLLDRSNKLRGDQEHFDDTSNLPLSQNHESELWRALTVLSTDLVYLAEDLQQRAEE
jgi:hypothetical protein